MVATIALSASAAQYGNLSSGQYFRLFAPLTFYHSVASNQLSIASSDPDEVSQAIDQALMHVYLTRPELVQVTQSEQEKSGALRQDIIEESVVKQEVEMVEQAAPMPEMPEAEPVQVVIEKPNFWKYKADTYLQFMQNYVSDNWYKGGENNYAAVGSFTVEANYDNKSIWKWDNKLEMKLGFQTSPSDTVHRFKANEDLLRYTGKVGLQAANRWYYTLQLLAYTQFTRGFKANNTKTFSDFMSPFNLSVGLGMDYKVEAFKKRLTGTVNIAPLAINYRYVDRADLAGSFGVKLDRHTHSLTDFGSQLTASLTWKLNDNVEWKSRIYGFTSYHRQEIEWENTFALRVSKYISANLFLFPRFDDANNRDENLGYWQFKEYSSLGFSYSF
ncbi:DUF3078 domain-containing protein [Prevotella sp. E15-22]|uniref:DUF3078 domain-containing protein n=1 Tax=Prevotella sp. E15-22 TaxID=2937774 RepID=UPI00205D4106|nr:DUF3078 domain-containing protein [Prevotella sp. E15-22]UPS45802.1 DUF3078 domain-containing protein [Prevotella sp. E15-22]